MTRERSKSVQPYGRPAASGAALITIAALTIGVAAGAGPAMAAPAALSTESLEINQDLSASLIGTDDFDREDGPLGGSWVEDRGEWAIDDGAAVNTSAGEQNNIATFRPVELGAEYTVSADIEIVPNGEGDGREWSGITVNVNGENPELSYFVLRVSTASADGGQPARWQLLRMDGTDASVVDQGQMEAPVGTALHLRLSRSAQGLSVTILDNETEEVLVDETAEIGPPEPHRIAGYAGLYSVTGNLRAQSFAVESSALRAENPSGDLVCTPQGDSYEFPSEAVEALDISELDNAWAGMFVVMDLVTREDEQYVGYWNEDREMVIAHRTLGDTDEDHSEWAYNTLDENLLWDSHNYISLGLDRDGNLHVSGNMHNDPMVYFRTTTPGDISTLERQDYVVDPATEQSVTYPEFVNRQDGSLVFSHRDGGSGDGVSYFNVYDEANGSWTRLIDEPLFDGAEEGITYNSYFEGPELGPDGNFHLLWVWRESPDAATNSMLSYARSEDLITWTDAAGNPLEAPFRYGAGDIVDPIPSHSGLLNGNAKIGFDADDEIIVTYHKYDDAGASQLYAARPGAAGTSEGAWDIHQLTDWSGRWQFGGWGTLIFEIEMLGSEVLDDGNIQVDFGCFGEDNSIVIDNDLSPLAHVPTPPLPDGLGAVRGDWDGSPGLQVNVREDRIGNPEHGEYILRWESLPENRDMPYDQYPSASTLEVIRLGLPEDELDESPAPDPTETPSAEPTPPIEDEPDQTDPTEASPTADPEPGDDDPSEQEGLAVTGAGIGGIALAALVALAGGAGLLMARRRNAADLS